MQPSDVTQTLLESKAPAMGERAKAWLRLALALLVILAGGEVLVRLWITGPSIHAFDPDIGYSYRPNSVLFQAKEGVTRLQFNALGLNDAEITPKNGRCRVMVVGDSYTTALQVPQEQNFSSVAERLDSRLDVVNGGRDGLFLGDLHKVSARLVPEVQPDLVVYVVSQRAVEADIRLPEFSVVVDPATGRVTDAVMRVEAKEALKETFAPLLRESALATRLSSQLQPAAVSALQMVQGWRAWLSPGSAAQAAAPAAAPAAAAATRPADEEVLRYVFRRLGDGTPAALLYIDALTYEPDRRAAVAPTSARAEATARRAAELAGVPFFATGEQLAASVARTGQPPYGFDNALLPGGHLNAQGHEAVGRALASLVHDVAPTLAGSGCSAK